ncbi:hypothetical protein V6N12_051004 [Hibiscus sabdariffa]|uniref:Uncharacterized protein n=1 Tax=Hibiscus sabdariffa TaxID=183260 RepID=A0ABR2GE08_9ROSI
MPLQYQSSNEHSNPLEQTFPTFTTSFDRLIEEMQELNKSMEARLVKMDERMINWGRSTSVMDNMPKGTEILRQEVSEQCEENPPLPTQHAQAEVKANAWAGIATSSNATTTSQDAVKSTASASPTESDAENDTIMLIGSCDEVLKNCYFKCKYTLLSSYSILDIEPTGIEHLSTFNPAQLS